MILLPLFGTVQYQILPNLSPLIFYPIFQSNHEGCLVDQIQKAYGKFELTEFAGIFDSLDRLSAPIHSDVPRCMEHYGTGYGYIAAGSQLPDSSLRKVDSFREKPNLETAKAYIKAGNYLWNAGIFVWNVNTIVDSIRRFASSLAAIMDEIAPSFYTDKEQEVLRELFPKCEKISIDYAVMEKADYIYTIPGRQM